MRRCPKVALVSAKKRFASEAAVDSQWPRRTYNGDGGRVAMTFTARDDDGGGREGDDGRRVKMTAVSRKQRPDDDKEGRRRRGEPSAVKKCASLGSCAAPSAFPAPGNRDWACEGRGKGKERRRSSRNYSDAYVRGKIRMRACGWVGDGEGEADPRRRWRLRYHNLR